MLDVEGSDWSQHSTEDNRRFLLKLKAILDAASVKITVYAGRLWPTFFGDNFDAFSHLPLIYAHYDLVPSFYDFPAQGYGGWTAPVGKQIWDGQEGEKICGTGELDWDWSPQPFWSAFKTDDQGAADNN
eukprot:COSAG06_NODE_351_length_16930_cov_7.238904_2_plen_129_part_00